MENTQLSLFGKTSPERSAATKERTSEPSSKNLSKSSSRQPLCLRFRRTDGPTPTVIAVTDGALRTEFLTLNTGESPSVAVESTLSSILEVSAPEKYRLSAKALRETGWISVKDKMPPTGVRVLVCRKTRSGKAVEPGIAGFDGFFTVPVGRTKNVTHWMPMPKAAEA